MSAKVQWVRESWWVITHFDGRRKKKRVGPTKEHKRQAERIAEKINAAIALGTFSAERKSEAPLPFDAYARDWLEREVRLPMARELSGALSPPLRRSTSDT